jgi:hypothetical protein
VPPLNPRRARLAARLREVRAAAFPSGNAFAAAIGWVQSRVSKLETGSQLPTEEDIRAWVATAGADNPVAEELLALLSDARVEYVNARDVQRSGGLADRQAHLGSLEAQATHLREYQPALIPGLVQTADYARELLHLPGGPAASGASEADVETMVAERIKRQNVLYQRGKTIQLVIGEAALRSPPGSLSTLAGQLDRLVAVTGLSTVELAILPLHAPMPALPMSGFAIHDDRFVLIETLTGEQRLDEPSEVAVYRTGFEHLISAAAHGPEALAIIRRAGQTPPTG